MSGRRKILTDKQLFKQAISQFREIKNVEQDIAIQVAKKLIDSDLLPVEWRMEDDRMLSRLLVKLTQWQWRPETQFDLDKFTKLKQWYENEFKP